MDKNLLARMFDEGFLVSATVEQIPMAGESYQLVVQTHAGKREFLTIAREKRVKKYAALKAAVADAKRIGFKNISLALQ